MITGLTKINGLIKKSGELLTVSSGAFTFTVLPSAELFTKKRADTEDVYVRVLFREPMFDFFGFVSEEEALFFDSLRSVSGVGPKSAMAILSSAPTGTIISAIKNGKSEVIARTPGVGKKSAQKIVLELQDKLDSVHIETTADDDTDIIDTLISLGYNPHQAREAIKTIPDNLTEKEDRLRAALQSAK
jgi:Holliday junction DNA helicase RuvA